MGKPGSLSITWNQKGHAVMDLAHGVIGFADNDGARLDHLIFLFPVIP